MANNQEVNGGMHGEESVTFLRTLARAEALSGDENWEGAARLWQQVVDVNPVEGRFWSKLGEARERAEAYREAIAAYDKALALRDGFPAETAYRLACCHTLLGEREEALASLEQALALRFRHLDRAAKEEDLAGLRDNPHFRELVGLIDADELSRDEGWRYDLRFLAREVKRRAYDPFRFSPREQFDAAVAQLDDAIPGLSDLQIVVEMNRLLRPLGDGHAYVWPAEHDAFRPRLPLQLFLFQEGLFVTAAAPAIAGLLGAQVLRVGERTVEEALAAVDTIIHRDNENEQWPRHLLPRLLRIVPLLHALGVAPSPDQVALTLRDLDGETREIVLEPERASPREYYSHHPEDWIFFPDTLSSPLPLYLRNLRVFYWFTYLREERMVYFQFNSVLNDAAEPLADFTERLCRFIDDHEVEKLVIDIRWNDGGNTFLEMPLLHRLIGSKVNQRGALFVIIGRATYSAAQNFANLLDRHSEAIFVGEPTGSGPTFIGETLEFTLPYSKTVANVSDLLWQSTWPMDYRTWLAPTLYTPPTFAAFRANRDLALEAILACHEHLPGWGIARPTS
jgi:tetratricopeptide (TPR) repeat protein